MMKKPLILLLFALLYYMPITLMAQCSMGGNLFTFTNGKGDSLWSQEANWDLMQVPGVNDCVLIESPHSVIFDVTSAMIREMTVNGAELSINAGTTLSIFEGVFDQSETTIENTGEISFTYIPVPTGSLSIMANCILYFHCIHHIHLHLLETAFW